ncbi:hypothetical protein Bbelb_128590 [Branchiostoma belcheri]|nr:hypothetical protein Bbelb_128590 [Branchiostoma belcheri]
MAASECGTHHLCVKHAAPAWRVCTEGKNERVKIPPRKTWHARFGVLRGKEQTEGTQGYRSNGFLTGRPVRNSGGNTRLPELGGRSPLDSQRSEAVHHWIASAEFHSALATSARGTFTTG